MKKLLYCFLVFLGANHLQAQNNPLEALLADHPRLQAIARQPEHQVQILYTQIDRDEHNRPRFNTYTYGHDSTLYFYPASTVKMPAAFLALEWLHREGLRPGDECFTGADRPVQTAARIDTSAATGKPSVAHYIKKIFLVSDNDAYNRLYELLGQRYLNAQLHRKGYERVRIVHRLSAPEFDTLENRYANPVSFYRQGKRLYERGGLYSCADSELELNRSVRGKGYLDRKGALAPEPFDFRTKNYIGLADLLAMLQAVIFPESVAPRARFDLTEADYRFLYRHMSLLPRESDFPAYPEEEYPDGYVKFFMYGDTTARIPSHIRIFNKVGDAYGFLTDVAYIVDLENGVEFFLAANIHTNENQIFNDGVYEYEETGMPFLAELGRAVYRLELARERAYAPDLERFRVNPGGG